MTIRLLLATLAAVAGLPAAADTFEVRTSRTESKDVTGTLYSEADGVISVVDPAGFLDIFPEGAVIKRTPGDDPPPLDGEQMIAQLTERFGGPDGDRFLAIDQGAFVIGLALETPLERRMTGQANKLLRKAAKFMNDLETTFTKFAKRMDLPQEPAEHKLVMVIFETDAMFDAYTEATVSSGLSAANIQGFYSHQTNWLAVRLDECDDFALPLHEGIHQQVYNRGWLKRGASVPKWFNEGIATGFEADGLDVDTDPRQVNARYASRAAEAGNVSFGQIIASDAAFGGDVLAGEAYTRAWGLHWLMVGARPEQYTQFVREMGQRQPGIDVDQSGRVAEFEATFDVSVRELEDTFRSTLDRVAARQGVRPPSKPRPGIVQRQEQMGKVELKARRVGTAMQAVGTLTNVHPLRPLTFRVTLRPDSGAAIQWVVPGVPPGGRQKLPGKQTTTQASSFRTEIESTQPDSREATAWMRAIR